MLYRSGLVGAAILLSVASLAQARDFSVISDQALETALVEAEAGDTIFVEAGRYQGPFEINGGGDFVVRGRGDVEWTNADPESGPILIMNNCDRVKLIGIAFLDSDDTGIEINDSLDLQILRCEFSNLAGNAVDALGSVGIDVTRCRFDGIGNNAVDFAADQTDGSVTVDDSYVVRCAFDSIGGSAIVMNGVRNEAIRNRMSGVTGNGVEIQSLTVPAQLPIVDGNRIVGTGIVVTGTQAIVRRNTIIESTGIAIEIDGGTGHFVNRNTMLRCATGMVVGGDSCEVIANRIIRATGNGLVITGSNNQIARLVIARPAGEGVLIEPGATNNQLSRASIIRAAQNGVHVREAGNRFNRNRAVGSGQFDLQDDTGAGQNQYGRSNRFRNVSFEGPELDPGV